MGLRDPGVHSMASQVLVEMKHNPTASGWSGAWQTKMELPVPLLCLQLVLDWRNPPVNGGVFHVPGCFLPISFITLP